MAIVKMRKLHLAIMAYDKDVVLNTLQRTGAVEVVSHTDTPYTHVDEPSVEGLKSYISSLSSALFSLQTEVENYQKEKGVKSDILKDGFAVGYSEFISAGEKKREIEKTVEKVHALIDEKNNLKAELVKTARQKQTADVYKNLQTPFEFFNNTQNTKSRLGVLSPQNKETLFSALSELELCAFETVSENTENALIFVTSHKSVAEETDAVLSSFGFSDCPYSGKETGESIYQNLTQTEESLINALAKNAEGVYAMKEEIRPLKVYLDYLSYVLEKEELSSKIQTTQKTLLFQAYVPAEAEEEVKTALENLSGATYFDFSDPTKEDTPPTLLKNNRVVENFEGITNTYSAPNYREFDPNAVMSFFYSLFMGFIIGDMGYGLLMSLVGGYIWLKNLKRPTGMSRLSGAFALGGVFTILWGALFNSFFGFTIFGTGNTIMPDAQKDMWLLAGISVPAVLVVAMELGVFQLFVGYICKAVQSWRRGEILEGIFQGVFWAFFSIGIGLAIVGFIEEANLSILATIGGITAGISLVLAMLTAGWKEKFFGKLTKGFGSAYGIINYASDILSYARLYGLMLSGAVIAQIIATYCGQFILSGNVLLIILGVVIMLVGHAFNLVMNLLGAYIHDARLQYVEFYGRFFEGEGELFTPLGSQHQYVYVDAKSI